MAVNNTNDIVINAKANTKEAEANLAKLDATVKNMAANRATSSRAQGNMVAATAAATAVLSKHNKELSNNVSLQKKRSQSLENLKKGLQIATGVIAGAVAVYKIYNFVVNASIQANKELAESLLAVSKAEQQSINTRAEASKNALSALDQLNEKAKEGALDTDAIQLENNLVKQLNDIWGDVGVSINTATGEIQGLLGATQQINENIRQQQIAALTKQINAQRLKANASKEALDAKYDSNGNYKNEWSIRNWGTNTKGALLAIGGGMEAWDQTRLADFNRLKSESLEDKAALEQLKARLKELQNATTQDELNRVLKQNAERQKAEATVAKNDPKEMALTQALAHAQMSGGDVARAKADLDAYVEQRNKDRYDQLAGMVSDDNYNIAVANTEYRKAVRSGDNAAITEAARALARATEIAKQHTDEMSRIAAGMYKPADSPSTELVRGITDGTFDAFGMESLGKNSIMQQQLDVQKKIEKNTEELARPVVGE